LAYRDLEMSSSFAVMFREPLLIQINWWNLQDTCLCWCNQEPWRNWIFKTIVFS